MFRRRRSFYRQHQLGSLYYNPENECTVYLERGNEVKKLTAITRNITKKYCVSRVVSWIKIANFTLDIALFSIFHKNIISAIVKRQSRGVRCRVLVYRHLMLGEKRFKHEIYAKRLKKAGVQIRWMSSNLTPSPEYRLVLIDCTDPTGRPMQNDNDMGIVFGEQSPYRNYHQITSDMHSLMVLKSPPNNIASWRSQFEEMWAAVDLDSEFIPSESEEAQMYSASTSKQSFFGMVKKR